MSYYVILWWDFADLPTAAGFRNPPRCQGSGFWSAPSRRHEETFGLHLRRRWNWLFGCSPLFFWSRYCHFYRSNLWIIDIFIDHHRYCHFYRFIISMGDIYIYSRYLQFRYLKWPFIIDSFWFWHNLWIRMNLHHESIMNLSLVEMPNSPKLQESEDLDKPVRCACVMCLRTPQKKNMDFQQERWFAAILQDYGEKTAGPCSQPGTIALIRVSSGSEHTEFNVMNRCISGGINLQCPHVCVNAYYVYIMYYSVTVSHRPG